MKKQLTFLVLLVLVGAFVFSLEGCGNKTVKPNDNICMSRKPLTANFKVEEDFDYIVPFWKYYATDTVASTVLNFIALDSLCSKYNWTIGGGTYNARKFRLYFPPHFLTNSEVVDVTLTVHKKPDALCFPKDDTIKTFTKKIYFTNVCNGLYKASFYGYLEEDPVKKFTITIDPCYTNRPDPNNPLITERVLKIDGFPQNCEGKNFIISYNNYLMYRKFNFGGSGCYFPGGTGTVQGNNKTIIIEYTAQKCPSPLGQAAPKECIEQIKHKFIGTLII
jgi:hypothetical protein